MASLKELGALVNAKVIGDPDLVINGVSSLDDGKPTTISYLSVSYTHLTLPTKA